MTRLILPTLFATLLALHAAAQETPAPPPAPVTEATPAPTPPVVPAQTSGCGRAKQLNT